MFDIYKKKSMNYNRKKAVMLSIWIKYREYIKNGEKNKCFE